MTSHLNHSIQIHDLSLELYLYTTVQVSGQTQGYLNYQTYVAYNTVNSVSMTIYAVNKVSFIGILREQHMLDVSIL